MSREGVSMEVLFVGTGVSTAIPVMGHFGDCACKDAIRVPGSKNKRNNVSILITTRGSNPAAAQRTVGAGDVATVETAEPTAKHDALPREHNVLIDCGKTFRTAYFDHLVRRNLRKVDALLLTHEHADAIQGLDDLRDLQPFELVGLHWKCKHYVPTFLGASTIKTLERSVGYIVKNSLHMGDAPGDREAYEKVLAEKEPKEERIIERRSTALCLLTLSEAEPHRFYIPGWEAQQTMYALPLEHGANYVALGFVFGDGVAFKSDKGAHDDADPTGRCFVYLSDVNVVPEVSLRFLTSLAKIDYLVVDMLLGPGEKHFSHFCWDDAWELIRTLNPHCVYATGMFCDLEHHETNRKLALQLAAEKERGNCTDVRSVECAFDGLSIFL